MNFGLAQWCSTYGAMLLCSGLCGCAGTAAQPAHQGSGALADEAPAPKRRKSIQAGFYRLTISAPCGSRVRRATGALRIDPIAREDAPAAMASAEGALLWGHADLDLDALETCLRRSSRGRQDPIHPSVLMEVLQWDEARGRQVLLVSTEPARAAHERASGAGLALWIETVEGGQLRGVWSRWQLRGGREGDWEAELVTP